MGEPHTRALTSKRREHGQPDTQQIYNAAIIGIDGGRLIGTNDIWRGDQPGHHRGDAPRRVCVHHGEDIRRSVYGSTANLHQEFGDLRVIDTPLSENGFFGAAVGASLVGMRPIVETLTSFMWVGMDQLISQAAKMRYMFGGQAKLPVVYRASMFYGGGSAAHHSDRSYPMFMNMPGLKIIIPSSPADVKGLLKTAIRDDDPCIVFEDGTLSGTRGEIPEGEHLVEFGKANVLREGTDCTVVGIAGAVRWRSPQRMNWRRRASRSR